MCVVEKIRKFLGYKMSIPSTPFFQLPEPVPMIHQSSFSSLDLDRQE